MKLSLEGEKNICAQKTQKYTSSHLVLKDEAAPSMLGNEVAPSRTSIDVVHRMLGWKVCREVTTPV